MDGPLLSPKVELLLKANRQHLCDRIHLDRSTLLDELLSAEVITWQEAETIKVYISRFNRTKIIYLVESNGKHIESRPGFDFQYPLLTLLHIQDGL